MMRYVVALLIAAAVLHSVVRADDAQQIEVSADQCLSCHNDERILLLFRTPHGQGADPDAPFANLQCESCHGPGSDHAGKRNVGGGHASIIAFDDDSAASAEEKNAVCLDCHTSNVGIQWTASMHERSGITCANCHSVHSPTDPVTLLTAQADVCVDCHKAQKADIMKTYAHPIRSGDMACSSCHNPHHSTADALLKQDTVTELCWSCHTDLKGPYLFEHAPASEDCSLCHNSHGSIHPALLARRPPLLCQSCHSQSGHPSISYTSDSLPGNNPSAFVIGSSCLNCHRQIHGSNHPSGTKLMR